MATLSETITLSLDPDGLKELSNIVARFERAVNRLEAAAQQPLPFEAEQEHHLSAEELAGCSSRDQAQQHAAKVNQLEAAGQLMRKRLLFAPKPSRHRPEPALLSTAEVATIMDRSPSWVSKRVQTGTWDRDGVTHDRGAYWFPPAYVVARLAEVL